MCMLCVAQTMFIVVSENNIDPKEGARELEARVKEIIAIRWDEK
jgi:hypothetical protein